MRTPRAAHSAALVVVTAVALVGLAAPASALSTTTVSARLSSATTPAGRAVTVSGAARPTAGRPVYLQVFSAGAWRRYGTTSVRTGAYGGFRLAFRPLTAGSWRLRVYAPRTTLSTAGVSPVLTLLATPIATLAPPAVPAPATAEPVAAAPVAVVPVEPVAPEPMPVVAAPVAPVTAPGALVPATVAPVEAAAAPVPIAPAEPAPVVPLVVEPVAPSAALVGAAVPPPESVPAVVVPAVVVPLVPTPIELSLPRPAPLSAADAYELRILQLVNEARAGVGAAPLMLASCADAIADAWAPAMAAAGALSHQSMTTYRDGCAVNGAGENLASTNGTADYMVSLWLASSSHRDNLLDPTWTHTGIAVYVGADGTCWGVQGFLAA